MIKMQEEFQKEFAACVELPQFMQERGYDKVEGKK